MNPSTPRYAGYHDLSSLPVRAGDRIRLPKGTPYTHRGELRETGRATTVLVNHVLEGEDAIVGVVYPDGRFELKFARDADQYAIRFLYGTDDLTALRPRMKVGDREGNCAAIRLPLSNPMVRWAGAGGYWSSVDINLVPLAGE